MSNCEHPVIHIDEEVEEHGPVGLAFGEPEWRTVITRVYRCDLCGAILDGTPPDCDDDISE